MRIISIKRLQKKCEELWKSIIRARDGNRCMVKFHEPNLDIKHTNIFQADHFITRTNTYYKFDPKNGTMVCASCNQAKKFHRKSVTRAIDQIVLSREGLGFYQQAIAQDKIKNPNPNYNKRWWLEEQLKQLEMELAKYDQ